MALCLIVAKAWWEALPCDAVMGLMVQDMGYLNMDAGRCRGGPVRKLQ